ncbi:MAG: tetratricopeptide repeat protein [Polyangiaceae bacterium]
MRFAFLVAPSDPQTGDAGARRMALAWLRGRLTRFGFNVVIVGGAQDLHADIERAIAAVSEGDTVLVHLSGRLAGQDALFFGNAMNLPLIELRDGLVARAPGRLSFVAELMHEGDPSDALLAVEFLDGAVRALGGRDRGHLVLACIRPLSAPVERVAFTRLAFPPPTAAATSLSDDALLAAMHERAVAMPESHVVAQSFTFARGVPSLVPPAMESPPLPPLALPPLALAPPVSPSPARSLDELLAEATDAGQWDRVLELRRQRLHAIEGPRHKVRELVAIARILQAELRDPEAAIEALEVARAIDRSRASVLQALRRGYEILGRWASAAEVVGTLADLASSPAERATLRVAQARIALDHLKDEDRAAAWLEAALEEDPTHAEARATLNGLRTSRGEPDADAREKLAEDQYAGGNQDVAVAELEAVTAREPTRATAYARLFAMHWRDGRADAAFLAAMSLDELGAAEVDQQVLIGQYRTLAPMRVRASLDDEAWQLLRASGSDDVLASLFGAVARAAAAARIDELRRRRRLPKLDLAEHLSETSTATIARTCQWAARFCSVDCPDLYASEQQAGGLVALQLDKPTTVLGPSVLRGLSVKDLAFLAGRHLTYYRPEYQILVHYPTREELTNLLLATVQVAMPDQTVVAAPVRALHARIAKRLSREDRADIEEGVRRLDERGGRASVGAWIRSAELTAGRVGLLLSGDLGTAAALVRSEARSVGGITMETRRGDMLSFCASRAHLALRSRFAMTSPESIRPAPTASGVHTLLALSPGST